MKWLVLIHVLSAIIGIGPTFFMHVLFRKKQSLEELRNSIKLSEKLTYFPKIGGTIAVLTGILLVVIGNYGSFLTLWMIGSLVLYIAIQVIVIAFVDPRAKRLSAWVFDKKNVRLTEVPFEQRQLLAQVNRLMYAATTLGTLLFIFMIIKPSF